MYINPYSFNILLHIYSDCVLCANMVYLPTYHKSYEFILKTVLLFSFHLLLLFTIPQSTPSLSQVEITTSLSRLSCFNLHSWSTNRATFLKDVFPFHLGTTQLTEQSGKRNKSLVGRQIKRKLQYSFLSSLQWGQTHNHLGICKSIFINPWRGQF